MRKSLNEKNSNPVIRLFRNEFPNDVWIHYCEILGIDEATAKTIVSVELEVKRILPQIN